jgi:tripartite motif-containing protein 71
MIRISTWLNHLEALGMDQVRIQSHWITQEIFFCPNWVNGIINKFDSQGNYLSTVNAIGWPSGLVVDPNNNLYQSEDTGSTIIVYNSNGQYSRTITAPEFNAPQGMAIDVQGKLIVANYLGNNILKFNTTGQLVSTISNNLANPRDVAIDSLGNIYATNWSNYSVSKFDPSGKFIMSFG